MSVQWKGSSRRQILRGAGGLALGLPFLPSLLPRQAQAVGQVRPRIVLMHQQQGGYWTHLNPPDSFATDQAELAPGHKIRWAKLRARQQRPGKVGISRIIQADPNTLTDGMLGRINLLRGVDHPNSRGHNRNGFGDVKCDAFDDRAPSVDQFLAYSKSFYASGESSMRSIITGGNSISYGAPGGISSINDPQKLFDALFMNVKPNGPAAAPTPAPKPASGEPVLVDALFDSYKQLRDSNRRLSTEDRRRLDNHMEHIADLQKRLNAPPVARPVGCAPPAHRPETWVFGHKGDRLRSQTESKRLFSLYTDIIAAAFACGLTRVAAIATREEDDPFSDYTGGWHELAHATDKADPMPAETYADSSQAFFEHVMLGLAKKLESMEEVPGSSYLDNTLIFYTQEASWDAHNQIDRCVLTVGNVNGFFKTGHFVDYRNIDRPECNVDVAGGAGQMKLPFFTGVPVQQWWGNVLQAFNIPRSEWAPFAKGTGGGYGAQRLDSSHGTQDKSLTNAYLPAVWQGTGNRLPIVT